jgi:teichoic acid transport system permease protein
MDLMRYAFMPHSFSKHYYPGTKEHGHVVATHLTLPHHIWITATLWAVVVFVAGFVFFWKAEEEYGRG